MAGIQSASVCQREQRGRPEARQLAFKAGLIVLFLLAAWLSWRSPLITPPGLEMDELIEAQIAEQIIQGDLRPFYDAGQGREGLYHYWLAIWMGLLGKHLFTLRIASTTISLLGLAATFRLGRLLFGRKTAFLAVAFGATTFWAIFSARSGLRSTALPLLAAASGATFWQAWSSHFDRFATVRQWHTGKAVLLALSGLFLGLSFYAYTAARVLPAIFLLFLVYLFGFHRHRLAGLAFPLFLWAAFALSLIIPFWRYLQAHPEADQFAFMDFNRPLAALEQGDPEPALRTTMATLGMFFLRGDPLIFDNLPGRPLFGAWVALPFLTGIAIALWRWKDPAHFFALTWLAIGLVPGMLSQPAPNFYRTVVAQVVAPLFPAMAIATVANLGQIRRRPFLSKRLLPGATLILVALQLAGSWRAYFTEWPEVEGIPFFWQKGLLETASFLDTEASALDVALCTVLVYEYDPWWRPSWQSMPYLMRQAHHRIRYYDCRSSFVWPEAESSYFVFTDPPLSKRFLPADLASQWQNRANQLEMAIPPALGHIYRVERPSQPDELRAHTAVARLAPEAGGDTVGLPLNFGDSLLLRGYGFRSSELVPGEPLALVTEWQVVEQPAPRLALFSHLLSDPQTVIAQQDGLGLTSHSLLPGDSFWVLHDQLWLPPELDAGSLSLSIGLYSQDTMVRLPILVGGQASGDRLFLPMPPPLDS